MSFQTILIILGAVLGLFALILHFYGNRLEQLWHQKSAKKSDVFDSKQHRSLKNEPSIDLPAEEEIFEPAQPKLEQTLSQEYQQNLLENVPENEDTIVDEPFEDTQSLDAINQDKTNDHAPLQGETEQQNSKSGLVQGKNEVLDVKETSSTGGQTRSEHKTDQAFSSLRQIDYWIKLIPSQTYTASEIVSLWQQREDIQFPVQLHALTQDKPQWVDVFGAPSITKLGDIVASYQLISNGEAPPLSDILAFEKNTNQLAQTLDAQVQSMATPQKAWSQAQKLHNFYKRHNQPIEALICAPEGQVFLGKLIETSAKQQGLEFYDGAYLRIKQVGRRKVVLYYLLCEGVAHFDKCASSDAKIEGVCFTMMPALSENPGRDAREMLDAVKAFASRVNGQIRIPGKEKYHQEQLLNLRNHVSKLEDEMIAVGLDPGGNEIQRIFS